MSGLSLFERQRNFSLEAYRRIRPALSRLEAIVLRDHLRHPDGRTDDEVSLATGLIPWSAASRRKILWDSGVIEDSGSKRITSRGSPATIWRWKPLDPSVPFVKKSTPTRFELGRREGFAIAAKIAERSGCVELAATILRAGGLL